MQNTDTAAPAPTTTAELDYVAFGFAEGALSIDGVKAYTWHAANALLARIQAANPESIIGGTYVKVDVTVHWTDGESYAFRYDVDHNSVNLAQRVLDGLKMMAGAGDESAARQAEAFAQGRDFNTLTY